MLCCVIALISHTLGAEPRGGVYLDCSSRKNGVLLQKVQTSFNLRRVCVFVISVVLHDSPHDRKKWNYTTIVWEMNFQQSSEIFNILKRRHEGVPS